MTSPLDSYVGTRSAEYVTAVPLTNSNAQNLVHRLRSHPGLTITLTVPSETAQLRAIDLVGHLLVDCGVPFETDGAMITRLCSGTRLYVVVDVDLQCNGPIGVRDDSDGLTAGVPHRG